jgi:Flp pilus assembly pilin Flp
MSGLVISEEAARGVARGRGDRAVVLLNKKGMGRGIRMELKKGLLAKERKLGKGQTMTEYSIIMLFVAVAAYGAYSELGVGVKAVAGNVVTFVASAVAAL